MTTAVFLNNDRKMPLLGLGVYKATGENEAENAQSAVFPEKTFLSQQKSGTMPSVSEMWRELFSEAWTVSAWTTSISILSTGLCQGVI